MDQKTKMLIDAFKAKKDKLGYSLRKIASLTGISFATLSRISRMEGEPDNNTKLKLVQWLDQEMKDLGLDFNQVCEAHFLAEKNIDSKTSKALIEAAKQVTKMCWKDNDEINKDYNL